jgi:hypothetical protein
VYSAAALAQNVSVAITALIKTSLHREFRLEGAHSHVAYRLLTILLYNINAPSRAQVIFGPTLHLLLMALYHLVSSGPEVLRAVSSHPIKMDYETLIIRARSPETKALLCLIATFDDLVGDAGADGEGSPHTSSDHTTDSAGDGEVREMVERISVENSVEKKSS